MTLNDPNVTAPIIASQFAATVSPPGSDVPLGSLSITGSDPSGDSKSEKCRVAVVSDHPLDLVGLRALVEAEPDLALIGSAADAESAREMVFGALCDVLVVSLPMPGVCASKFLIHCRQENRKTKIITLTDFSDVAMASELMKSGADGCMLKRSAPADLGAAIRRALAGGRHLDAALAPHPADGARHASLSERERKVLKLMAHGYTSKQIAALLQLSIRTVETYKTRSMRKLSLRTRADAVRYAVERGWVQNPWNGR